MGLKEDIKKIFLDLFGPDVANQVERFEDPERYPQDFLEECIFFLAEFVGEQAATSLLQPVVSKYNLTDARSSGRRRRQKQPKSHKGFIYQVKKD